MTMYYGIIMSPASFFQIKLEIFRTFGVPLNYSMGLLTTLRVPFNLILPYQINCEVIQPIMVALTAIINKPVVILPPLPISPEPPPNGIPNRLPQIVSMCFNIIRPTVGGQEFNDRSKRVSSDLQHNAQ